LKLLLAQPKALLMLLVSQLTLRRKRLALAG
jgi:hypothetical protein